MTSALSGTKPAVQRLYNVCWTKSSEFAAKIRRKETFYPDLCKPTVKITPFSELSLDFSEITAFSDRNIQETSPCQLNVKAMDSPATFYDSEVDTKAGKKNPVFLFEDGPLLADYGDLYENEGSIDLSSYLDPSGTTVKNDDLFQEFGFLSAASTSTVNPVSTTSTQGDDNASSIPDLIKVGDIKQEFPTENTEHMPQIGESTRLNVDEVDSVRKIVVKIENDDSGPSQCQANTVDAKPSGTRNPLKSAPAGKAIVKGKRMIDKESEEYRQRRQRNNVAVRKSREKSKQKQSETQRKVSDLQEENDRLQKKVELLTKELTVLKTLFTNVGVQTPVFNGTDSM
ncbi:uncharacterized protein LOC144437655 [Glandiceps talaboti]